MKKLKNIEELDALFKQQLDKAEVPAPPDAWANVSSAVGGQSSGVFTQLGSYFSSITNIVKLALFVGGVTTVGVLLYNANTTQPEESDSSNEQLDPIVAENETQAGETIQTDQAQPKTEEVIPYNEAEHEDSDVSSGESSRTEEHVINSDHLVASNNDGAEEVNDATDLNDGMEEPGLNILSDKSQICIGETITFRSQGNVKGNWYVNGKLLKRNSEVLSHRFAQGGDQKIELSALREKAQFDLMVNSQRVEMQVKDLGNGQYELSLADNLQVKAWYVNGKEFSTAQKVNARLLAGPTHIMVAATDGKCNYTASKQVNIESRGTFSSPDILTPDNDGKNDEYYVDISHYQAFMLQIYDSRTNALVFQTSDPKVRWNGKINNVGADCSSGLYFVKVSYQLEGEQPKSELIKLTLNR